jgi:hypothetical protein
MLVVTNLIAGSFFGQGITGRIHQEGNSIPTGKGRSSRGSIPNFIRTRAASTTQGCRRWLRGWRSGRT